MGYWNGQLYELREMSEQDKWEKRVGHNRGNPWGVETPIGHIYSIIVEEAARNNIPHNVDPKNFLEEMKNNLGHDDRRLINEFGTMTPSYCPEFSRAAIKFMKKSGFDAGLCADVMKDVVGPDAYEYNKQHIEIFYFNSQNSE